MRNLKLLKFWPINLAKFIIVLIEKGFDKLLVFKTFIDGLDRIDKLDFETIEGLLLDQKIDFSLSFILC